MTTKFYCYMKLRYSTLENANKALAAMDNKGGLGVHLCSDCQGYHIGFKLNWED